MDRSLRSGWIVVLFLLFLVIIVATVAAPPPSVLMVFLPSFPPLSPFPVRVRPPLFVPPSGRPNERRVAFPSGSTSTSIRITEGRRARGRESAAPPPRHSPFPFTAFMARSPVGMSAEGGAAVVGKMGEVGNDFNHNLSLFKNKRRLALLQCEKEKCEMRCLPTPT